MIVLHKDSIEKYLGMDARLDAALQMLKEGIVDNAELGRYEDSDVLYHIVQRYDTKVKDEARWESHKKWIDIQYIRTGTEQIDVLVTSNGLDIVEQNEEKDLIFYHDNAASGVLSLTLEQGMLAIFYPEDIHKPCVCKDTPKTVEKVVFKVKI